MKPTLRQLQYIVAIADTGRFGAAAKQVNVSQPSLSAQVSDVEARLGVMLVERGRNGAVLTPMGQDFVRRSRSILQQVEDLKAAMSFSDGAMVGRLRLGVLPSIGPYLLPTTVKLLHARYPELRMSVREMRTIDLETALQDGVLDMVISTADDHPETDHVELFRENLWICAAQDDPLANSDAPVIPKDLGGRELLSVGLGHRLSLIVQKLADMSKAHVSMEFEGTSLDAVRQMAAMGAGLAILPTLYTVSEARRDPDLVLRPIDHPLAMRDISLVWRRTSPLGESFRAIGDVMRDVAAGMIDA